MLLGLKCLSMTLDRDSQRAESGKESSVYSIVAKKLKQDGSRMFHFLRQGQGQRHGGSFADPIDAEMAETYELIPNDIPTLFLPGNLSFVDGFSYVTAHWYPLIRIVATEDMTSEGGRVMDEILDRMFPDGGITRQVLQEALRVDPSGATWLEERAKVEFNEGTLALIGARRAITGARKMYEALASTI